MGVVGCLCLVTCREKFRNLGWNMILIDKCLGLEIFPWSCLPFTIWPLWCSLQVKDCFMEVL